MEELEKLLLLAKQMEKEQQHKITMKCDSATVYEIGVGNGINRIVKLIERQILANKII
jgi:hypothetical protein